MLIRALDDACKFMCLKTNNAVESSRAIEQIEIISFYVSHIRNKLPNLNLKEGQNNTKIKFGKDVTF